MDPAERMKLPARTKPNNLMRSPVSGEIRRSTGTGEGSGTLGSLGSSTASAQIGDQAGATMTLELPLAFRRTVLGAGARSNSILDFRSDQRP